MAIESAGSGQDLLTKTLVLGIGQPLRGDDEAGLEAVHLWQEKYPETAAVVTVELCDFPGLTLLERIKDYKKVVLVDCVIPRLPGERLIVLQTDDLLSFPSTHTSAHSWGIAEALHLGHMLVPEMKTIQLTLIGIAGKDFSIGEKISHEVQNSLPEAVELIQKAVIGL